MASGGSSDQANFNEFIVKVPKNTAKKYSVMRFSGGDQMDIQKWKSAKITRDLSAQKIYQEEEVYPEFGAGSEYGRKQREQARKLKYGMRRSKFKVDDQPWKLSVTTTVKAPYSSKNKDKDKTIVVTKDFDGKKEGGIGEGSMYFVFMQSPDHTFEAYPVDAWYNFTRRIKHRTLTDEEAEAEWDKRDKIMNHLNFMARKRLQIEEDKEGEEEPKTSGKKKNPEKEVKTDRKADNGLLIHDEADDELLMSESDESSDEEQAKKAKKLKKKQKEEVEHDAPEEGMEESDDGDGEGQEQDYNSDISSEEETANDSRIAPKGLNEAESSSSSEEEEENKPEEEQTEDGKPKTKKKKGNDETMSTSGESEVDSDIEKEGSALFMNKRKTPTKGKKGSSSNSRSSTPSSELLAASATKNKLQEVAKCLENTGRISPKVTGLLGKRHAPGEIGEATNIKRQKIGASNSGSSTPTKDLSQPQNIITEESVRRYLQHKPITTKDLLKKFKTKKTGLTSEQIVNTVARILKRLNPEQTKISGKIHLFLKQ